MLRAFRIASENNFEIEPSSLSSIKKYSYLLKNQAGERIKAEIFKLLKTTCSYPYLMQLINSGPINEILPELINLKHCSQNRHHSYDVFDHTLKSYSHMENIIANLSTIISDPSSPVHRHLNEHKKALIKWTILLHDIGKPFVKSEDEEGNIHFYGHAAKSAEIAEIISKRLRFSNYEAGHVDIVVRNHNRPLYLFNLYKKNQFKKKHLTRFFLSCDEYVPDILLHGIADHKGKAPDSDNEFVDFLLNAIKNFYLDFKSAKSRPRLLTGNDLIRVFGLKPSPAFKTVLKYIEEERLSGHIHKKEEAIKIAEEFLMNSKNSNP
jgi:tRNA nucleotidyltransferase/poly(A) polymerase